MMKRKQPSSIALLDESDARKMADQVADELERGIRLSPKKRPRTIPLHDPFFVGTPEEEALHLQRLEGRKRKSEDFSVCETRPTTGASGDIISPPRLNEPDARQLKIPRRSRAQASVVDIDALNRKLSSFDLSEHSADGNANPCRALTLYSPNPLARPTISSIDDLNEELSSTESSLLSRYRNPFRVEDLSRALIIYPEEHPLQSVIDRVREYERRTGRSSVEIRDITSSSSLDDIDDGDDQPLRMFEDKSEGESAGTHYLVDDPEEEDGEGDRIEAVEEVEEFSRDAADDRIEEILTEDDFLLPTSASSSSSSSTSTSPSFLSSSFSPFTSSSATTPPPSASSPSSFSFFATSAPPPVHTFGSSFPFPSFLNSSSSSSSSFLSSPPVFANVNPFPPPAPTTSPFLS